MRLLTPLRADGGGPSCRDKILDAAVCVCVCVCVCVSLRVVKVYVDGVCRGLLQVEEVDGDAVEDVGGGGQELVKAPALLLIGLQDAGQHGHQLPLQAPARAKHTHSITLN